MKSCTGYSACVHLPPSCAPSIHPVVLLADTYVPCGLKHVPFNATMQHRSPTEPPVFETLAACSTALYDNTYLSPRPGRYRQVGAHPQCTKREQQCYGNTDDVSKTHLRAQ